MLDDIHIQGDGVATHQNRSEMAVQASTDGKLCTMYYVRLTLQSDLTTETPASIFAAHEEQGTIFYLPELTALPALDEYTTGKRYLQYHVLIITPLECSVESCSTVFDSLGSAESVQLGIIGIKHSKDATSVFSQYFLSAAGRGSADLVEVSEGLQELLEPVLVVLEPVFDLKEAPEVTCQSEENIVSQNAPRSVIEDVSAVDSLISEAQAEVSASVIESCDSDSISPMSELEFSLNAPRGIDSAAETDLSVEASNGSSAQYISKVCDHLVPLEENNSHSISCFEWGKSSILDSENCVTDDAHVSDYFSCKKTASANELRSTQQEEKLNRLISRVSEMSGMQSKLYDYAVTQEDDLLRSMADEFDRLYCVLRDSALELRMVSLEPLLHSVKDWLEDAAQSVGRQLQLTLQGADVQVDAVVAEAVTDALATYFSASVLSVITDTEFESISLTVEYSGTDVLLFIDHLGCGGQGTERNLQISEALLELQSEVLALHGAMAVGYNDQGRTSIKLSFPLTQAMIEGLIVQCGDEQYIVPMNQVAECVDCSPRMGVEAKENKVVLGGESVPYVRLREYVDLGGKAEHEQCIVIQSLSGTFGLIVDGIVGELQAAVKPVGALYKNIEMISGVSVKADGVPSLVVNLQHLQTVADCLIIN